MWSPLDSSRNYHLSTQGRQLVRECESFLTGQYPSFLQARGLPVPEGAWLSLLVHAPADVLVDQAAGGPARPYCDHLNLQWRGAVALLAQELVIVADRAGCGIEDLQRDVLLQVELGWDRGSFGTAETGPSRIVEEVRHALSRYRRSSHPR